MHPLGSRRLNDSLQPYRNDPDAQLLTDAQLTRMQRPNIKVIRRALGLTQRAFAKRFHIPIDSVRDWEEGHGEPDQTT